MIEAPYNRALCAKLVLARRLIWRSKPNQTKTEPAAQISLERESWFAGTIWQTK